MLHHGDQPGARQQVFDVLKARGFVQQVTDEAAVRKMLEQPTTLYIGYDPTAPSLHVGNLFTLMGARHLQQHGHKVIVVLGGGTAMVGDPSGKTELRPMLSAAQIAAHIQGIRAQIERFLDPQTTVFVNNADWLMGLHYVDFLRDIGRHFSVNRMLSAESSKQRLQRGLSFIEFNYQILQAYDYLELCRRYGCTLQMGGDDQWGNILAGVDLCRRVAQREVAGLTLPLLLLATGQKMGKTATGAVWLDATMVSPYDYYQYWVNVHDEDVARLLAFFTFLPMVDIAAVQQLPGGPALNLAKSVLAYEATALLHGEEAAREAHLAALGAFGGRSIPPEFLPSSAVPRQVEGHVEEVPTTQVALGQGLLLADLLVQGGLAESKKQARRLIEQGAVRLNDAAPTTDPQAIVLATDFVEGALLLRAGKKKVHRFTA